MCVNTGVWPCFQVYNLLLQTWLNFLFCTCFVFLLFLLFLHFRKLSVMFVCLQSLICSPSAVLEGQSIEDVATTVQALTACAVQFRQSAV